MSSIIIVALILAVLLIIAALAFALYKTGFRTTEITVKTGPVEAKMARTPTKPGDGDKETPSTGSSVPAQFRQEALKGSKIRESSIEAPADSPASASQKAEDDSSLDDTHIKLT